MILSHRPSSFNDDNDVAVDLIYWHKEWPRPPRRWISSIPAVEIATANGYRDVLRLVPDAGREISLNPGP
jgi:hypothetical protein